VHDARTANSDFVKCKVDKHLEAKKDTFLSIFNYVNPFTSIDIPLSFHASPQTLQAFFYTNHKEQLEVVLLPSESDSVILHGLLHC
jgi:hypothetical protein